MCRYSEFHPFLFDQHAKLDPAPLEFESFNKVGGVPSSHVMSFMLLDFCTFSACDPEVLLMLSDVRKCLVGTLKLLN